MIEVGEVGQQMDLDPLDRGTVTSAVGSPELGRIGLALVHRRVGEPPLRLELEGGGAVELFALPDPPAA